MSSKIAVRTGRLGRSVGWAAALAGLIVLFGGAAASRADETPAPIAASGANGACLECHSTSAEAIEVEAADGERRELTAYGTEAFAASVHGRMACTDCHTDIQDNDAPHQKVGAPVADCATCHDRLWEAAKAAGTAAERPALERVVKNAAAYRESFHARPDADHPERAKATCTQCHNTHTFNVPAAGTPAHDAWRATIPALCGESCHEDHLEDYSASVHGVAILEEGKSDAAVCSDCHTTHQIDNTSKDPTKLLITSNCGNCHEAEYKTYRATYHGQVHSLGYAYTAKCFDCHGSHDILKPTDPDSSVHPDNRLETCRECHDGKKLPLATAGFVSFGPHAHAGDFERYPQLWIATRFMVALLIGVFAFFWLHCGLWYYREWKDRRDGVPSPRVKVSELPIDEKRHVRRFAAGWRAAHLAFALVTMTLVLTGTAALYAETAWARSVVGALGGPANAGIVHRVAATLFVGIFFIHFVYVMFHLLVRRRGQFRWFGPDSLIPRWQDFIDCYQMFRWFLGMGPRPLLDRWAYFEKFDYWAVFWGVNVIGFSGLMLAFPNVTASLLPGWVFNVATLVHGEEAFLAAVFLFTVHFFNNHFRPDKLPPPDIVMFTGTQSLEEFRRDHPAHYNRLVEEGRLEAFLVDAPSGSFITASRVLGLVLIGFGLILLVLVSIGFFSTV
ncbi:MAG: cytochrome b/b6 domain-containing protein [Rhodocyclaceae bacterium]|nr:cytochrome b/b6 domain-containing protein [Rhodocyclaceae bacterium]